MSIKTYQILKSVGLTDQRVKRMLLVAKSESHDAGHLVWPKGARFQPFMGLALFAEAMASSSSHLPHFELEESLDIPLKQSLLAAMCGVSRGIFSVCVIKLADAGLVRVNYATVVLLELTTWRKFSQTQRQTQLNHIKPSMQDILLMMQKAVLGDNAPDFVRRLQS